MIFEKYSSSIKYRLIVNVILIHAVLMGLITFDMVHREKDFVNEQLSIKGYELTSILASNAGTALINNDIVALDELLSEMDNIRDNYMVFILDKSKRVRASNPSSYFNKTLTDDISKTLFKNLNMSSSSSVQYKHKHLLDTVTKIYIKDEVVGYARTILDAENISNELNIITKKGLLYIIVAIVLGAIFAWLSVRKMTYNLNRLTYAANELADHNFKVELPKIKQNDEVSIVVNAFRVMQNSLHEYIKKIDKNEKRLKLALEGSSDGLWDWNLLTNEVYFSPRYKEMLGYNDDEFENSLENWEQSLHPKDKNKTIEFVKNFLDSTDTIYEQKFRMIKKDGEYISILARAKKVYGDDGKAIRLIGTHVDMSEIDKAQSNLKFQAEHDSLTNLPNRLLFNDRLQQSIKFAKRNNEKIAVLFLDLDNFKQINDSLGHDFGDKLLVRISKILVDTIRDSDTVARIGGDEFTIILDKFKNNTYIIDIVQKIIKHINAPHIIESKELYTSFSIGVSVYPEDGDNADTLLKNADAAMYKAKSFGKNTYRFYTNDMTEKALERMILESKLRQAIESESLEVFYQPQVDAISETIIGLEALVRWKDKDNGYIPPSIFIPLAEETGMITTIDTFVMKTSIAQLMKWKSEGKKIDKVSINISVIDFEHKEYVKELNKIMSETQCSGSMIELEITESQIMKDSSSSIEQLKIFSEMGIKLAIDDFGTGYSSLAYLKQLPIDKLKIDKSFVDDLDKDNDDQEIVKTIISMAQNLNLKVIAEGVESKEQKEFLTKHGCMEIQGYYFYKPMSANDISNILK